MAPGVTQIHESQRTDCHSTRGDERARCGIPFAQPQGGSQPRVNERTSADGSQAFLDCANPGCTEGCPVGIDIPRFIKNIERGEFLEAAKTLKETSALPAVCGRVCPQEKQCESKCIHLKMNEKPVAIGYLERFAADYEREADKSPYRK